MDIVESFSFRWRREVEYLFDKARLSLRSAEEGVGQRELEYELH